MTNSSHANHLTADTPGSTSPVNRERRDSLVPASSAASPKIGPSIETDPALAFMTSTAMISTSDPDPSEFDFTSSFLGRRERSDRQRWADFKHAEHGQRQYRHGGIA
jgi:hypothetical protein